jgi:hypothetical protein
MIYEAFSEGDIRRWHNPMKLRTSTRQSKHATNIVHHAQHETTRLTSRVNRGEPEVNDFEVCVVVVAGHDQVLRFQVPAFDQKTSR